MSSFVKCFVNPCLLTPIFAVAGVLGSQILVPQANLLAQEYRSSITATDFDFITESDPSTFVDIKYVSKGKYEMPDKRSGDHALRQQAFLFSASFKDKTKVNIYIDADFETQDAAMTEAKRYVHRLGKLPTSLRKGVERLVVHQGGKDTTAFSDIGLIVVYSENATKRISTHDLEETVFHESVHAAWDKAHAKSERWVRAQAADNAFVTVYGKTKPTREDLAESAIFAYTLLHHPERIPAADAKKIKKAIPNRIEYIARLLPPNKPIFYEVKPDESKTSNEEAGDQANTGSENAIPDEERVACRIELPGTFADILSNALMLELQIDEAVANKVTSGAQDRFDTSEELFQLAISELKLDEAKLKVAIKKMLHCNCKHDDKRDDSAERKIVDGWKVKSGE